MGIIIKQAAASTILSYIGVALGFLNVAILMNRWISTGSHTGFVTVALSIVVE